MIPSKIQKYFPVSYNLKENKKEKIKRRIIE